MPDVAVEHGLDPGHDLRRLHGDRLLVERARGGRERGARDEHGDRLPDLAPHQNPTVRPRLGSSGNCDDASRVGGFRV